jgi:hypothetical protein
MPSGFDESQGGCDGAVGIFVAIEFTQREGA